MKSSILNVESKVALVHILVKFLNYLNSKHENIKFTMEIEDNNKLSLLDILIEKTLDGFTTDQIGYR